MHPPYRSLQCMRNACRTFVWFKVQDCLLCKCVSYLGRHQLAWLCVVYNFPTHFISVVLMWAHGFDSHATLEVRMKQKTLAFTRASCTSHMCCWFSVAASGCAQCTIFTSGNQIGQHNHKPTPIIRTITNIITRTGRFIWVSNRFCWACIFYSVWKVPYDCVRNQVGIVRK